METREIPGYYYDPDKKKYFKVVKNAPAAPAYSAESVKRRKLEHDKAQKARIAEGYKKRSIRRSRTLQDPLLGGFLARELGTPPKDLLVDCWSRGLCSKGSVRLGLPRMGRASAEHLFLGTADEKRGLGIAIGSIGDGLHGTFIPRDENDRIVQDTAAPFWMQEGHYLELVPQVSSLKYHEPSSKLLVTSRDPGVAGGIYSLTFDSTAPALPAPDGTSPPGWDLRRPNLTHMHNWSRQRNSKGRVANTCAPAPAANSSLICVVGTSRGLGCYSSNGTMLWLENLSSVPPHLKAGPPPASDILSIDFLPNNPQTVLAGLRGSRKICLADLRQNAREWEWIVHRSSPAHVRCLSEHHVLAAGPNHSMSIYDLRFRFRETSRNRPVVIFPEYRNDVQIHFGLDVDTSLGVVAAANHPPPMGPMGQGMSIFSLETGKRLDVPAVRHVVQDSPPNALVFHTLPREPNASLFVSRAGVGCVVEKFSLGGDHDEWTGENFGPLAF